MTYATTAAAAYRKPTMVLRLTLDQCSLTFSQGACTATGTPCYYTYPTCKARGVYARSTRDYDFSMKTGSIVPGALPHVISIDDAPTKIEFEEFKSRVGTIKVKLTDDWYLKYANPNKAIAFDNLETAGTFWKNLYARNPNYRNRPAKIYKGFSDLAFSGYQLLWSGAIDTIIIDGATVTVELKDKVKLFDSDLLCNVSDTNVLAADLSDGATSMAVTRASEFLFDAQEVTAFRFIQIRNDDQANMEYVSYTNSGVNVTANTITINRGQGGTVAKSHSKGKKLKGVALFESLGGTAAITPATAYYQIFTSYANLAASEIDTAAIAATLAANCPALTVKRIITEQVKVSELLRELNQCTNGLIWQNEAGKISLTCDVKSTATLTTYTEAVHIIKDSVSLDANEKYRCTGVVVCFNATSNKPGTDTGNYLSFEYISDENLANVNYYGKRNIKKVFCPWIILSSDAQVTGAAVFSRWARGATILSFALETKDAYLLKVGDFCNITSSKTVTETGAAATAQYLIIEKKCPKSDSNRIEFKALQASSYISSAPSPGGERVGKIAPASVTAAYVDGAADVGPPATNGYIGDATNNTPGTVDPGFIIA